ncbi:MULTISPECIES: hypothetical protein [unclassified Streptomyces]|uniref:hypothetical protein n=1 Tax=unclassified Streptomyces TaxID=2593676 RepID=UPI00234BCF04|nr:hypothetical protein [Streptomyces sp. M92]WCN02299.1 hypothetical protein M6G08_09550 [Streptomyces sp. M92]
MRRTAKWAATVAAACTMIGFGSSSAQADDANAGIYTGWNQVGYCEFRPYGEHLIIKDRDADGHSIIAELRVDGYGTYYYWNSSGSGTTRDVDLDFAEDHHVTLRCLVGDWQGTPTGGIIWDSYDKMMEWVTTWT